MIGATVEQGATVYGAYIWQWPTAKVAERALLAVGIQSRITVPWSAHGRRQGSRLRPLNSWSVFAVGG